MSVREGVCGEGFRIAYREDLIMLKCSIMRGSTR